jgi:uncharacterized delta-60 repeat protein
MVAGARIFKTEFQPRMPNPDHHPRRKVRPSAVLLLTVLCVAGLLAPFPEYWDFDRQYHLVRRDHALRAQYAQSLRAASQRAKEAGQERQAARVAGRVTGSIDGLFDFFVNDLVEQPDGKILVAGYHNDSGIGIARLKADGSLDEEFVRHANWDLTPDIAGRADQVALAPDGKVVLAGRFQFHGSPRVLLRFQAGGILDGDFMAATTGLLPAEDRSRSARVAIQADGAIVLVEFGHPHGPPLRLRSDGALDRGWDPAAFGPSWEHPVIGADGRLTPLPMAHLLSVRQDGYGRWQTEGEPGGLGGPIQYLGVEPAGRLLLILGREVVYDHPAAPWVFVGDDPPRYDSHLILVERDGSFEELLLGTRLCEGRFEVRALAFQSDGGLVLAGDLPLRQDGGEKDCEHVAIWRVDSKGALDRRFRRTARSEIVYRPDDPNPWTRSAMLHKLLVLQDGRILIGGRFSLVQGQPRHNLARLREDGSVE